MEKGYYIIREFIDFSTLQEVKNLAYKYLLDLALILLSTKLLSMLSKVIRLPTVVGALLAGIVLGPAMLGVIGETEFLSQISEIGVIVIMFTAGVTTDLKELRHAGRAGFLIALCGVVVPLVSGVGIGWLSNACGWTEMSLLESIFLGTVLTATSVTITVETLKELGKLETHVGSTLLAAALIDDVLGLIALTVVSSLGGADVKVGIVLLKILLFFVFALIVAVLFSKFFHWMLPRNIGRSLHLYPTLAFVLCLGMAYCAEQFFGVAGIIGAFTAGIVVATTEKARFIESKFVNLSQLLLTPVFFAGVGLKFTLDSMSLDTLWLAITIFIVAVLSKIVGCGLSSRACGFRGKECLQIGSGMACRGEVALIVANKGVAMGLLGAELLSAIILMIVGCAVLVPIMLKFFFRNTEVTKMVHSEIAEQRTKLEQLEIVTEGLLREDREIRLKAREKHTNEN